MLKKTHSKYRHIDGNNKSVQLKVKVQGSVKVEKKRLGEVSDVIVRDFKKIVSCLQLLICQKALRIPSMSLQATVKIWRGIWCLKFGTSKPHFGTIFWI